MARREYTDHEKANALALLKVSRVEDVHEATSIPIGTLKDWKRKPPRGALELQPEKEASLADELRRAARALVDAIPSKIADAPLNHTAIALGIIFDKLQLLEGKPTSIDEVRGSDAKRELADRLARLASDRPTHPRAPN